MLQVSDRDMFPLLGNIEPEVKTVYQGINVMRSSINSAENRRLSKKFISIFNMKMSSIHFFFFFCAHILFKEEGSEKNKSSSCILAQVEHSKSGNSALQQYFLNGHKFFAEVNLHMKSLNSNSIDTSVSRA